MGGALANAKWVRDQLGPVFDSFSARWRDELSPPGQRFIPLLINGQAAGFVDRNHEHQIVHALGIALNGEGQSVKSTGSHIELGLNPSKNHDQAFQSLARLLADEGLVPGWRGEWQWVQTEPCEPLARAERALFKTLGLQSQAIHVHVETAEGLVWTAVRAMSKHENPGMLDNLAAGGVAGGEDVAGTLWRELIEEAGLTAPDFDDMQALFAHKDALLVSRALLTGGWHHEKIHLFKGRLKKNTFPHNQDGEVHAFELMTPQACAQHVNAWEFTPDAGLCTALALQSK